MFNRLIGPLSFAAFGLSQSAYTVEPGHRAVIFDRLREGIQPEVKGEGLNFAIPFVQTPIIFDVRKRPTIIKTETGTKDLQNVQLSMRLITHPDDRDLQSLYRSYGTEYVSRLLPSVGNEVLKAVVAQFNADQLITQREQVSQSIRESLAARLNSKNVMLDDVSITHLTFSDDFSRAIEAKQVAEQKAEQAKFVVARKEQEKLALIIRSEGDAEAAKMVSEALAKSGNGLIELRRIETALQVADTLGKSKGQVTYLPSQGNILMNIPAGGGRGHAPP